MTEMSSHDGSEFKAKTPEDVESQAEKSPLQDKFRDILLRSRLAYQGQQVEDTWLDDEGHVDFDKLPGHLRGPARQMIENSEPVVEQLLNAVDQYNQPRP